MNWRNRLQPSDSLMVCIVDISSWLVVSLMRLDDREWHRQSSPLTDIRVRWFRPTTSHNCCRHSTRSYCYSQRHVLTIVLCYISMLHWLHSPRTTSCRRCCANSWTWRNLSLVMTTVSDITVQRLLSTMFSMAKSWVLRLFVPMPSCQMTRR